ncbi:MAG: alkaline phosphatase family protein [Vicinamibacteria bacterium]|nr:alkaline phosphatase family protein [Vicinamibacteria bacterium]
MNSPELRPGPPSSRGKSLTLAVFIDALGAEVAERHGFLEGHLETRARVDTVLGYSCTCVPTILTGRLPEEHGHFSFFRFDPERSPFRGLEWLRFMPKAVTSRARVRNAISKVVGSYLGFNGYFNLYNVPFERLPYLDYTERKDLYEPGGIIEGQETLFDHMRSERISFALADWRANEASNVEALGRAIRSREVDFAYLYLARLDGIMHAAGPEDDAASAHIRGYEQTILRMVDLAHKNYDQVRLHVFSDHGMTPIRETVDIRSRIDALGLTFGRDYGAVYDSTMARFWYLREGVQGRIEDALRHCAQGRWFEAQQQKLAGCHFEDARYGEGMFLLNPGVLLCPSDMGERPIAGMHGYHPADADSTAFFGSTETIAPPRRLDGLHDLLLGSARENSALRSEAA